MKRFDRTLAALVPIFLAGCNGAGVSGGNGPDTGGLTEENSDEVGHAIAATVAGGGAAGGGSSDGGGAEAHSFSGDEDVCWAVSGDESDADGDEIPANALYTLADCTWSEEGWTSVWNGTEGITDANPDEADFAYAYTYDLTATHSDEFGNTQNDAYSGSSSAGPDGDAYVYAEAMDATYSGSYEGYDYEGAYAQDLVWAFTPANEDFTAGTETVDGTWSESFDGESVSVSISTTDPLVFDLAVCDGVISGTIVATSGDATETITWTGCDEYTLTYDGS